MRSDSSPLAVSMMIGTRAVSGIGAQRAADLQAVHARQHHVQQDHVGHLAFGPRDHVLPGGQQRRLEAGLLQVVGDQLPDIRIVLDDDRA